MTYILTKSMPQGRDGGLKSCVSSQAVSARMTRAACPNIAHHHPSDQVDPVIITYRAMPIYLKSHGPLTFTH